MPLILPELFVFGLWVSLIIGIVFVSIYARQVTQETLSMGEALVATQMALTREQKLTDLGGVVAAAAHELGTPLATIKLVSSELIDELGDNTELCEDAKLIRDQANRCRDILQSMGRAGKEDHLLRHALIETVIREASEPHLNRGKDVRIIARPTYAPYARHPDVYRRPEIIHGVRNLIQNAVDFADTAVDIVINWTDDEITLRINDDGPGYPPSVLGRIGEPFVRRRKAADDRPKRPGYEGMGLGLFIAKTLLERSGASLEFANGGVSKVAGVNGGAIVILHWPHNRIEVDEETARCALGQNTLIT